MPQHPHAPWQQRQADQLVKDFTAATKVPLAEYKGRFCVAPGSDNYGSPEDWADDDERACAAVDGVRFVWGCKIAAPPAVDMAEECYRWLEDTYEDAFDGIDPKKLAEVQRLVDEMLADIQPYEEDQTIAVILPDGVA